MRVATDDERREVAQNMRDGVKSKTECELLSLNGSSAAIRWLISYVVFGDEKYHSGVDLMNRLADLIEPSDTSHSCRDGVACDRKALLALADEMDEATCDNRGEMSVNLGDVWGWAECIREALGATS